MTIHTKDNTCYTVVSNSIRFTPDGVSFTDKYLGRASIPFFMIRKIN